MNTKHSIAKDVTETIVNISMDCNITVLQWFDAVGWAAGRASGL